MSETDLQVPQPLPRELEQALQLATSNTIASLVALRKALRQHVRDERSRGVGLVDINLGVRAMLTRVEERSPRAAIKPGSGRGTLSAQVVEWSEAFFRQVD